MYNYDDNLENVSANVENKNKVNEAVTKYVNHLNNSFLKELPTEEEIKGQLQVTKIRDLRLVLLKGRY
jgi:hypothetical protein